MHNLLSPPSPSPVRAPILVVEDDEAIRDCLHMLLEGEGYGVAEATTPTDALVHLRGATRGHIVLLDWMMLGRGESLLRQLEQEPADGPLHQHCYVMLSAAEFSRFTEEEQRLIAATCLEAVAKPFEVEALLAVIERAAAPLRAAQERSRGRAHSRLARPVTTAQPRP
jgi:CheY-like chemotaxis protein